MTTPAEARRGGTSPQDRRTRAALAFAEAVWKVEQAERAGRMLRGPARAAAAEAEYQARAEMIGAEQAWFEVAAAHEPEKAHA